MLRAKPPFKLFPLSSIRSMAGSVSCVPSKAVDVQDIPNQSQCDPSGESQLVDVVQDPPSVQVYRVPRTSRSDVVGGRDCSSPARVRSICSAAVAVNNAWKANVAKAKANETIDWRRKKKWFEVAILDSCLLRLPN